MRKINVSQIQKVVWHGSKFKHGIEKRRKLAWASPRWNDREQCYQNI